MSNKDEIEIHLPKLGESITSASIVQWFKKEGDSIELDEPLLEVSTDKVSSEIPSPVEGTLAQIVVRVDEEVSVGALLATITPKKVPSMQKEEEEKKEAPPRFVQAKFYTPVVAKIAEQEGISFSELEQIPGTGVGGRLSKRDLEAYLTHRNAVPVSNAPFSERIKMSPMRKKIAEAMVRSFYSVPHATVVNEVDVTALAHHLKKIKKDFFEKNGYKITITSYVIRAISVAIKKYPLMNASLDGETIVLKKQLHLGLAISAFDGVLVPVIQDADTLSLEDIARAVGDRVEKARTKRLTPKDMEGGTFTLTNFGMEGALFGTPIIRHPEVAILGVGAIHQKIAVLKENTFAMCSALHLSCSFDHRVFDGIYACGFIKEIKKELEEGIDASRD